MLTEISFTTASRYNMVQPVDLTMEELVVLNLISSSMELTSAVWKAGLDRELINYPSLLIVAIGEFKFY